MKKRSTFLRMIILAAMLFALAVPVGVAFAEDEEKPPYIFLRIYNESQFDFTLWVYGPNSYTITVEHDSEGFFVIDRGWYSFTMEACNLTKTGTIDFTTHQTIHVPICGATAGHIGNAPQHIDASDYIRPATIKIRNKTQEKIEVYIRTLDEHHFLTFEPLEEQYLLIEDASKIFTFSYTACDVLQAGNTRLYVHVPFDLTCNK